MTLEEKAREWVSNYKFTKVPLGEHYVNYITEAEVEEGYLAGANEVKADCDFALEGKDVEIKELRDNYEQYKAVAEPTIKELRDELVKKADTNHSLVEQMADLESENAELKAQIEKMKCFKNCLTFTVFKCPAQSDKTIKSCSGCKHWKLKE